MPNEKNKTMLNYIQIYRKQLGSSGLDTGDSVDNFFPWVIKNIASACEYCWKYQP